MIHASTKAPVPPTRWTTPEDPIVGRERVDVSVLTEASVADTDDPREHEGTGTSDEMDNTRASVVVGLDVEWGMPVPGPCVIRPHGVDDHRVHEGGEEASRHEVALERAALGTGARHDGASSRGE